MVLERRALLMLKPDGVQQGLASAVEDWLRARGFTPTAARLLDLTPDLRRRLYATTRTGGALDWDLNAVLYTLGPVLVVLLDGEPGGHLSAAHRLTSLKGDFRPSFARGGTLRADVGALNPIFNLAHTSDDPDELEREVEVVLGRGWHDESTQALEQQRRRRVARMSPWSAVADCVDVLASRGQPIRQPPSFRTTLALAGEGHSAAVTRAALLHAREALRRHTALLSQDTSHLVAGVSSGRTDWSTWLAAVEGAGGADGSGPPWTPYLAYTTLRYLDLCLGGNS